MKPYNFNIRYGSSGTVPYSRWHQKTFSTLKCVLVLLSFVRNLQPIREPFFQQTSICHWLRLELLHSLKCKSVTRNVGWYQSIFSTVIEPLYAWISKSLGKLLSRIRAIKLLPMTRFRVLAPILIGLKSRDCF